ncbi:MAG: hypothetical protein SGCHY_002680 [Lobulomycetales sp.]
MSDEPAKLPLAPNEAPPVTSKYFSATNYKASPKPDGDEKVARPERSFETRATSPVASLLGSDENQRDSLRLPVKARVLNAVAGVMPADPTQSAEENTNASGIDEEFWAQLCNDPKMPSSNPTLSLCSEYDEAKALIEEPRVLQELQNHLGPRPDAGPTSKVNFGEENMLDSCRSEAGAAPFVYRPHKLYSDDGI